MNTTLYDAVLILIAFAIGSVPFGLVIARMFFGVDLRTQGSGNIGAANAMRTIGKGGAVATLVLDALKGFVPVAVAMHGGDAQLAFAAAVAAIAGHCFSPFLGGHGGKGVATALGALAALAWPTALVCVIAYIAVVKIVRISAVGSLLTTLIAPVGLTMRFGTAGLLYGIFVALLVFYTHRSNIARLAAGQENRFRKGT